MKASAFNKKYEEFIEKRHYGNSLSNEVANDYLDKEFEELIKIPGFKFTQIKQKFQFFRVYCSNVPQEKLWEIENKLYDIYNKK